MSHYPGRALVAGLLLGLGLDLMLISYSVLPFGILTLLIPLVLLPALTIALAYAGPARPTRTVHTSREPPAA